MFWLWPIDGPLLISLALLKSKTSSKQIVMAEFSRKHHGARGKQPGFFDLLKESLKFQEALCLEWLAAIRAELPKPEAPRVMVKAELREREERKRA